MPPRPVALAVCGPADGPENFARDEALRDSAVSRGAQVWRVYSWSQPTISVGRNERVRDRLDPRRARNAGFGLVRRPTGGRALVHTRELTYGVAGPCGPGATLRSDYAAITQVLRATLTRLGVTVAVASPARTPPLDDAVCFAAPAAGELTHAGRKLVASAQWRTGHAYLQHGSILIADDQARLREATVRPGQFAPPPPAATLLDALGRVPSADEFATALAGVLAELAGRAPEIVDQAAVCPHDAVARYVTRYRDDTWTWRR